MRTRGFQPTTRSMLWFIPKVWRSGIVHAGGVSLCVRGQSEKEGWKESVRGSKCFLKGFNDWKCQ